MRKEMYNLSNLKFDFGKEIKKMPDPINFMKWYFGWILKIGLGGIGTAFIAFGGLLILVSTYKAPPDYNPDTQKAYEEFKKREKEEEYENWIKNLNLEK